FCFTHSPSTNIYTLSLHDALPILLVGILLIIIIVSLFILSLRKITQHGESLKVPSVVGKNFTDAREMLEAMGFEVVVQDSVYQSDRKSTRLNSSHVKISYAVFCLK